LLFDAVDDDAEPVVVVDIGVLLELPAVPV
jgi:hypothetical protein